MTTPSLKIAGLEVSLIAMLDYDHQIDVIEGATPRRMAGGALFKMSAWRKHRITISAGGWVPVALNAVNYTAPFEVELPMPVALRAGETLPDGWSSRAAPWAEHSVTDQAGQTVRYVYPKLTVFSSGPVQRNGFSTNPSWEITLEQA